MMIDEPMKQLAEQLGELLLQKSLVVTTAESCTGGGLGYALTTTPGSSVWYEQGIISYSNEVKQRLLAVPENVLFEYGAVSEQTAKAMAAGALHSADADLAVAITGIAGPDGGSDAKPVGTVWFGLATLSKVNAVKYCFSGDRQAIREQAIVTALQLLIEVVV